MGGGRGTETTNRVNENRGENPGNTRKQRQNRRSKGRKRNKVMRIMNTNAQSLINKMNDMEIRVKDHKPKLISVTETWGKEWIKDGILDLKGYKMYRNDRNGKRGGGSILYISDNLDHRECKPLNAQNFESSSWCWLNEEGGKKILVGSIYRSTSSTQTNDTALLELLNKANEIAGDNRVLIMGDFNVPNIDWEDKDLITGARPIETQMLDTINDCFLYQHIEEPTRRKN